MAYTEQELRDATDELRSQGKPTMGAWAPKTRRLVKRKPDTVRYNGRLHAHDYLESKRLDRSVDEVDPTRDVTSW